jgi:error-prone DNA polymerase
MEQLLSHPKPSLTSKAHTLQSLFIRNLPEDPIYTERLQEEFALIDRNNFTKVFLQVRTILELSKDIPHIIRGSAGSSLVCYLLGITSIDPIKNGIELARFMNTARQDLPDIDIDVPYNRRDELYKRIAAAYPKMVARISNHILYRSKTAIRQALREEGIKQPPKNFNLEKIVPDKIKRQKILTHAFSLIGSQRATSKHCGGIVIFEEEGEVPENLIYKPQTLDDLAQIKLNKDETEDAGYIKIDLLSNRGIAQLTEISDTDLLDYPRRDLRTECLFARGDNIGITFAESRGMYKILVEMAPQSIIEIAIALALIRPAAAAEGRKADFLKMWKARLNLSDPLRRPILFDDDAIAIIRSAIHCTPAEADQWRKVFAKSNHLKINDFKRLLVKNGHTVDFIESVLDDLHQLSKYSFCKSHALSYAQLVWALAYWKANSPHDFWVATLNHCQSEYRPWVHKREARNSGLLLPRAEPPYRLGKRNGNPAIIPVEDQNQCVLLKDENPLQILADMSKYHTWFGAEFLPNCHMTKEQMTLDGKVIVSFCGIIATGRVTKTDPKNPVTLVTIGIENRRYIDIVYKGEHYEILRYTGVTGKGYYNHNNNHIHTIETIEAIKISGISIRTLLGL